MASVQVGALIVAWGALPIDAQTAIVGAVGLPAERVPLVLGLLMLAARLIDQPKVREGE